MAPVRLRLLEDALRAKVHSIKGRRGELPAPSGAVGTQTHTSCFAPNTFLRMDTNKIQVIFTQTTCTSRYSVSI
jgi:hypothetical protein